MHDHLSPSPREESSNLGSGAIFGRGAGGSGVSSARMFRANRPRKPIATKVAPAIISQCGKLIDESRSTYFPFAAFLAGLSPVSFDRMCRIVSIIARIASGRVSDESCSAIQVSSA